MNRKLTGLLSAAALATITLTGCTTPPTAASSRTVAQVAIAPAAIEEVAPVTVTAKPKTVEVTKTETVNEVPQSCLDALNEADQIIQVSIDQSDAMSALLGAYADYASGTLGQSGLSRALTAFSASTDANTEKLKDVEYADRSSECRAQVSR